MACNLQRYDMKSVRSWLEAILLEGGEHSQEALSKTMKRRKKLKIEPNLFNGRNEYEKVYEKE